MHFDAAFDDFQLVGHAHQIAPVDQHLPVARHCLDAALEKLEFFVADRQLFGQRGNFLRHACIVQQADNPFAAGQRMFVFLLLAL